MELFKPNRLIYFDIAEAATAEVNRLTAGNERFANLKPLVEKVYGEGEAATKGFVKILETVKDVCRKAVTKIEDIGQATEIVKKTVITTLEQERAALIGQLSMRAENLGKVAQDVGKAALFLKKGVTLGVKLEGNLPSLSTVLARIGKGEECVLTVEAAAKLGITITKSGGVVAEVGSVAAKAGFIARLGPYAFRAMPVVNVAMTVVDPAIQTYKLYKETGPEGGSGVIYHTAMTTADQAGKVRMEAKSIVEQENMSLKMAQARDFARQVLFMIQDYGIDGKNVRDSHLVDAGGYHPNPINSLEDAVAKGAAYIPGEMVDRVYGVAATDKLKPNRDILLSKIGGAKAILKSLRAIKPEAGSSEEKELKSTIAGLEQVIALGEKTATSDKPPAPKTAKSVHQEIQKGTLDHVTEQAKHRFEAKYGPMKTKVDTLATKTDYDMSGFTTNMKDMWTAHEKREITAEEMEGLVNRLDAFGRGIDLFYDRAKERGLIK